jgi:hypothetical protein
VGLSSRPAEASETWSVNSGTTIERREKKVSLRIARIEMEKAEEAIAAVPGRISRKTLDRQKMDRGCN